MESSTLVDWAPVIAECKLKSKYQYTCPDAVADAQAKEVKDEVSGSKRRAQSSLSSTSHAQLRARKRPKRNDGEAGGDGERGLLGPDDHRVKDHGGQEANGKGRTAKNPVYLNSEGEEIEDDEQRGRLTFPEGPCQTCASQSIPCVSSRLPVSRGVGQCEGCKRQNVKCSLTSLRSAFFSTKMGRQWILEHPVSTNQKVFEISQGTEGESASSRKQPPPKIRPKTPEQAQKSSVPAISRRPSHHPPTQEHTGNEVEAVAPNAWRKFIASSRDATRCRGSNSIKISLDRTVPSKPSMERSRVKKSGNHARLRRFSEKVEQRKNEKSRVKRGLEKSRGRLGRRQDRLGLVEGRLAKVLAALPVIFPRKGKNTRELESHGEDREILGAHRIRDTLPTQSLVIQQLDRKIEELLKQWRKDRSRLAQQDEEIAELQLALQLAEERLDRVEEDLERCLEDPRLLDEDVEDYSYETYYPYDMYYPYRASPPFSDEFSSTEDYISSPPHMLLRSSRVESPDTSVDVGMETPGKDVVRSFLDPTLGPPPLFNQVALRASPSESDPSSEADT